MNRCLVLLVLVGTACEAPIESPNMILREADHQVNPLDSVEFAEDVGVSVDSVEFAEDVGAPEDPTEDVGAPVGPVVVDPIFSGKCGDQVCPEATPFCLVDLTVGPPVCVECLETEDCGEYEECNLYTCEPNECERDGDCFHKEGTVCINRQCAEAECYSAVHCREGEKCFGHVCEVPLPCDPKVGCPNQVGNPQCVGGLCTPSECDGDDGSNMTCGGDRPDCVVVLGQNLAVCQNHRDQ